MTQAAGTPGSGHVSVGSLLRAPTTDRVDPQPHLCGFGGLHGGLAVALLTTAMERRAPGAELRSVAAAFHGGIRSPVDLGLTYLRHNANRGITTLAGRFDSADGVRLTATVVATAAAPAAVPAPEGWSPMAPTAPPVPPPVDCPVYTVPADFVPVATQTEVRPATPDLPYAGAARPELVAWLRLVEDDDPPDVHRLIFLLDAIAPSYAAVLTSPVPIPTVEMSVRPGPCLARASSPWVLLAARTTSIDAHGWVEERIDAWSPDGAHLGSAHQLRLIGSQEVELRRR